MNRRWVGFHLGEVVEELQTVINILDLRDMTAEEFELALERAYHHLNTAWNSRSISDEEATSHSDEDFVRWRRFPRNLNLSGE